LVKDVTRFVSVSAGGGVFSRSTIRSGAAGDAGLYAAGTKLVPAAVSGTDAVVLEEDVLEGASSAAYSSFSTREGVRSFRA